MCTYLSLFYTGNECYVFSVVQKYILFQKNTSQFNVHPSVHLKMSGLARQNIVHLENIILHCVDFCIMFFISIYSWQPNMAVGRCFNRHANISDHRSLLYFTVEYAIIAGLNSTKYIKVDHKNGILQTMATKRWKCFLSVHVSKNSHILFNERDNGCIKGTSKKFSSLKTLNSSSKLLSFVYWKCIFNLIKCLQIAKGSCFLGPHKSISPWKECSLAIVSECLNFVWFDYSK